MLVTILPLLVRLLLFLWRFLLGRRWRAWFSWRGMLRLLCSRRRGRGLGFGFRGWLGGRPVRSRWRRRRFCWLRMSRRLSAPLGSGRSGLVRSRRRSGLACGLCRLGCRLCGLSCFPHGFSRLCRRRSGRTSRSGSLVGDDWAVRSAAPVARVLQRAQESPGRWVCLRRWASPLQQWLDGRD